MDLILASVGVRSRMPTPTDRQPTDNSDRFDRTHRNGAADSGRVPSSRLIREAVSYGPMCRRSATKYVGVSRAPLASAPATSSRM